MSSLKRVWMVYHYDDFYHYDDAYRETMLK